MGKCFCLRIIYVCRQLHRDNRVLFAGYMVPHPLEHHFVLRVQTIPNTSPFEVIKAAVDDLQKELTILEQQVSAVA